jgi:hypothetical protein
MNNPRISSPTIAAYRSTGSNTLILLLLFPEMLFTAIITHKFTTHRIGKDVRTTAIMTRNPSRFAAAIVQFPAAATTL